MLNEWLSSVRLRLRAIWKRSQLDRDLHEEMAFHLAMREEKLRSAGKQPEEAHYAAQRVFGNATKLKEETRMLWTFRWLEDLGQDLRHAGRSMHKSPIVTVVVVLSLALGIGANTAIFSLIDAVMLRLLPIEKPEELVLLQRQRPQQGDVSDYFTNPLWESIRDRQDVFSGTLAWSTTRFNLTRGGAVQYARGMFVSGSYFGTLGVQPAAGRLLDAADDRHGCAATAVLSYGFWRTHFGGANSALGSNISLNHQLFQIIGVSSPTFYGVEVGEKFDVAVPVCSAALFDRKRSRLDVRSWWWLNVMGRVRSGITPDQASARIAILTPQILGPALPQDWSTKDQQTFMKTRLTTVPAATGMSYVRRIFREPLRALMAIVAVVLLIACANIASLMLARAIARSKEIAVRKALGASRSRLVRQVLTESVLLSSLGAVLGLLFARWGSALLVRGLSSGRGQVLIDLAIDKRVMGFAAGVALFTGILVGLLPALRSTSVSLMAAMKGTLTAEDERRTRFHIGKWIVGAQLALSFTLLIGGGLLLRTFVKLLTLDIGFDAGNVLLVNANLDTAKVPAEQRPAVYEEISSHLQGLPGVSFASRSWTTPLSRSEWDQILHTDSPNAPTGEQALVFLNFVSPTYFETMHTPMLFGRGFSVRDTKSSPSVAVVNQTLARKFFSGVDPIGKTFYLESDPGKPAPVIEIVGVVKDAKYESMREDMHPTAFFPILQMQGDNNNSSNYEVRTTVPPSSLIPAVQQAIGNVNKEIPLEFHTLAEQVDDSLVRERLLATLSSFFSALALLLAMIGLYGVLSYLVTQRQTEFGIRMALGAQPRSVLRLVMVDVLAILTGGLAVGVGISLVCTRFLQEMLFGLGPRDLSTMVAAVCVLSAIAILAGGIPAWRASRVDPMVALRYE